MNLWPSRDILDALGWTLLHFLWQGLVVAALLAVALRLLRRRSANLRYLAGCLALLLMTLAPVATYFSLTDPDESETPEFIIQNASVSYGNLEVRPAAGAPSSALPTTTKLSVPKATLPELLETSLPWLVTAWSLGVLTLSCRLFAGWLLIQRLRRTATTALLDPWQTKLKQLAARVGVSRPLRLLQSAWVEVPTVIGWLRPVILLPASCLTGLTPAQLESILAHELAHIHRHDYLINLLQNVVETLLFYHPAVWWVSRRIRQEREHCCDDLAVKICGDPLEYARALATLEELRPAPAQLQLAASGAPLLERIRRLAGQPERSAARPAWPVAGVIAVVLLAPLVAGLRNNPASAQSVTETLLTNRTASAVAPANLIPQTSAATPPAPALPFPNQPPFVKALTRPSSSTNAAAPAIHDPIPQINIKTKWVEADADKISTNLFSESFGAAASQSLQHLLATFVFSDFLIVRPTNSADPDQFIYFHQLTNNGPLGTFLKESQMRAVMKKLEPLDGVDILTAPEMTTESGRQCQIQAVDINNIVYGGALSSQTNSPRYLTNQTLPFGPIVDVIPYVSADGQSIELTVIGSVTEFVGYEDPATVTNLNGKPMPKGWAIPHMRLRQFTASASISDGQTLVLPGSSVPIAIRQQIKQKVPFLGSIPVLGHLFRSTYVTTNTTQKVLMLFVTPTLINADGTRYHSASADQNTNGESASRINLVYTSKGRRDIMHKLDSIRVDSVAYDHLPLSEVINNLAAIAKTRDPEKTGINFFISGTASPATNTDADITSATITINPALKDVRLADVLDAIKKTSSIPIKYSIKDYAVVFFFHDTNAVELPPLEIRTFHLNPEAFPPSLDAPLENSPAPGSSTNGQTNPSNGPTGITFGSQRRSWEAAAAPVRRFLVSAGTDFDTNNPANVGKAFAWNDRKGLLTIRATSNDLEKIQTAVVNLDQQLPLPLETRTYHVNPDLFRQRLESVAGLSSGALGTNSAGITFINGSNPASELQISLRDFLSSLGVDFNTNNPANAGKAFVWGDKKGILTVHATRQDLDLIAAAIETLNQQAPLISLKVKFALMDFNTNRLLGIGDSLGGIIYGPFAWNSNSTGEHSTMFSGILSEAQSKVVFQALESRDGVQFLDAPEITTPSGVRAQATALPLPSSLVQHPADSLILGTPTFPFTPVLNVIPIVSEDNFSIQMHLDSRITEFINYSEPGKSNTDMEGKTPTGSNLPLPHFHVRHYTNDVTLSDGSTFIFTTSIATAPIPVDNSSHKKAGASVPSQKCLMIYITPTIVNPDGTSFHTKQQRSSHQAALAPSAK